MAANPMLAMGVGGLIQKLTMVGTGNQLTIAVRLTPAELTQLQMLIQSMVQAQAAAAGQGVPGMPGMPGMPGASGMPGMQGAPPQSPMMPPGRTIKPPSTK